MGKYFAALDVSHLGLTAVAARWEKTGEYVAEDFFCVEAEGFRKGSVDDMIAATDAVSSGFRRMMQRSGKKIGEIYVGVSSASLDLIPSTGMLMLSKYGRTITDRDIYKCLEIGAAVKIPLDKEVLQNVVNGFSVDGERNIKNPLHLEGVKLGVDIKILTINSSVVRNLEKCVANAGFIPAGFVFSGVAASYRVLSEEYKREGCVMISIARDLTEVLVYSGGMLKDCRVFPKGAQDMELNAGGTGNNSVIDIAGKIRMMNGWDKVKKGVVIGEGLFRDGLVEEIEKALNVPIGAGNCISRSFENLPPDRNGYITSLGILDYFQERKRDEKSINAYYKRFYNKALSFIDKYF